MKEVNIKEVTIPREALKKLISFGSKMFAQETIAKRKRPAEDYETIFGSGHPIFEELIMELKFEEWDEFKKTKAYQQMMNENKN